MSHTRTIVVTRREAGQTLAAVLHARLALSWSKAKRMVESRRVRLGTTLIIDPTHRMKAGHRVNIEVDAAATSAAPAAPVKSALPIRYADTQVVVVEKPAGLTTMRHAEEAAEFGTRAQRYLPATLLDALERDLAQGKKRVHLRAVHRLDKDTSGLVAFARTAEAESHLGRQFRGHTVGRRYLAIVRGKARTARIESTLVSDRGDGRRGSTPPVSPPSQGGDTGGVHESGKKAVTHVRVLEDLGAFTLVECRLETGRTHQVRIHLGEAGTPICGETIYDRPLHGAPLPDESGAPRLALHAAFLEFEHPASGQRVSWHSPLPKDLADLLKRLKGNKSSEEE